MNPSVPCYWNLFEPSTRWEVAVVSCLTRHRSCVVFSEREPYVTLWMRTGHAWRALSWSFRKNHQEWVVHLWLVVGISRYFNLQPLKTAHGFGWVATTSEISGMPCSRFAGEFRKAGAFGLHSGQHPIPVLYACVCLCIPYWCCWGARCMPLEGRMWQANLYSGSNRNP